MTLLFAGFAVMAVMRNKQREISNLRALQNELSEQLVETKAALVDERISAWFALADRLSIELQGIIQQFSGNTVGPAAIATLSSYLGTRLESAPDLSGLTLYDAKGAVWISAGKRHAEMLDAETQKRLQSDKPVLMLIEGNPTMMMVMHSIRAETNVLGILVALIDPKKFRTLLDGTTENRLNFDLLDENGVSAFKNPTLEHDPKTKQLGQEHRSGFVTVGSEKLYYAPLRHTRAVVIAID